MSHEFSKEYATKFIAQHADTSEEIKRFRYLLERAKQMGRVAPDIYHELGLSFERVIISLVEITEGVVKEMDSELACAWCTHPDLRDLGHVKGVHVYMCRKCKQYSAKTTDLVALTNEEILTALPTENDKRSQAEG